MPQRVDANIISGRWTGPLHDAFRIPQARAARRSVGVRLRLAHVVAGFPLEPEIRGQGSWLSPFALRVLAPLSRYRDPARPGDGALPLRLVLGHDVPRFLNASQALASLFVRPGNGQPRRPAAVPARALCRLSRWPHALRRRRSVAPSVR